MTYATPPATALAQRIAAMMPDTEPVHQHPSRGLDHGAWVPLKIMYPDGDVPVLQMSLPTSDPQRLLALGERLRPLRDEGVLIIGSGFLTHGLPFLTEWRIDAAAPGWSQDFDAWAGEALARGDVDALASYQAQAPGMPYAHPTVEHYTPLFVTLGAATDPEQPGRAAVSRASGWGCRSGRSRSPDLGGGPRRAVLHPGRVHPGMGDRLRRGREQVVLVRQPVVRAEAAQHPLVLGPDPGEEHGDPSSLEPPDRVGEHVGAGGVDGRDPRQAQDHHPDLGDVRELEQEVVGDREEQGPVDAVGHDVLVDQRALLVGVVLGVERPSPGTAELPWGPLVCSVRPDAPSRPIIT